MCGIAGIINFNDSQVSEERLRFASRLMQQRGPDYEGIWIEGNCGLAHRRLSIIDLSPLGNQPMISSNERYVIAFNGEIYNFEELKSKLGSSSELLKGTSDTEILLECWSKWGLETLDMIDGMFSFTIWDRELKKLIAARDRMGEKPYYYFWDHKTFAFASRPKPLFELIPNASREYDHQGLRYFLESGYIPAPYTIHSCMKKLPASHYLEVDESGIEVKRYWNTDNISTNEAWVSRSEDDLLDELDEILYRSVEERMVSDVPIGAFLSGGIDSSLIVAMMTKINKSPIKTYTIGFDEERYDESHHAKSVADHLGTEHSCENLKVDDLLDLLPVFLSEYDEPFFDSAAFPTLAVSKLASQSIKVNLTGDGGDELFGGYHYYRIAKSLNPFFQLPEALRSSLSSFLGMIPQHQMQLVSKAIAQKNSARSFAFTRSIAKDFRQILGNEILDKTNGLLDLFDKESKRYPSRIHPAEQAMRLDAKFTMNDDYLQKTDVATMAFSLEARAPLLSRSVIEWAMQLPIAWKVRLFNNKYLLRKLSYRYIPQKIMDRPKRGFGVPIDEWLRNQLNDWASIRINDKEYYKNLPLDQSAVINLFKLHKSGKRDVHPLLWAILMLLEFNSRSD